MATALCRIVDATLRRQRRGVPTVDCCWGKTMDYLVRWQRKWCDNLILMPRNSRRRRKAASRDDCDGKHFSGNSKRFSGNSKRATDQKRGVIIYSFFGIVPRGTLLIQAISQILKNENYERCFLAGFFINQITTRNKRYSRLAVVWNVSGFHELGLFRQVPWSNYVRKKGTVVWPLVAMFGGFHELGLFWRVRCYVFWQVPW